MITKMLIAFVLSFFISIGFGKYFVPWLKKKDFSQPLKDEVAQMYLEKENDTNQEDRLQ